jgi:DNA polymerase-4
MNKPNAITVITEDNFKDLIWGLPVGDLLYVGRATTKKFVRANIKTIGDLAITDIKYLKLTLGKMGETLWNFANGNECSSVGRVGEMEKIKSFGNSTTCPIDLTDKEEVKSVIYVLAESVVERMKAKGFYGTTVSLWVRDSDLNSFERQATLNNPTNIAEDLAKACYKLFIDNFTWDRDVRAVGVRIGGLCEGEIQYDIFKNGENLKRKQSLENAIEKIRERFGYNVIRRGNILMHNELTSLNPHMEKHIIHPKGFFKSV